MEGQRVPLPSLLGQMRNINNSLEEDGLLQMGPAPVQQLFTSEQLASADGFLTALQTRFLNGSLNPLRLASMRQFVQSRLPLQEARHSQNHPSSHEHAGVPTDLKL